MLYFSRARFIVAIILGVTIISISASNGIVRNPEYKITDTILSDLPKRSDLIPYLRALGKILTFMDKNKHYIDINFTLGLFLVNVNLKNIIKVKQKLLPVRFRNKLNDIVNKTDALLGYFNKMVSQDKTVTNRKNKLIYSLFTNQSLWVERIRKFNIWKQMQMPSAKQLEDKYTKWNTYMKNVEHINEWVPKPRESDKCMVSLARNPINRVEMMTKCKLADSCYDILMNGSDFGYALSHRLLLLLVARYGRGCVVFTPFLDRELTRRFCTASYGEAEYISMHGYQLPDLLLEQIVICTMTGRGYFLRRRWMNYLLNLQMNLGCFGEKIRNETTYVDPTERPEWKPMRTIPENCIFDCACDLHITSVASAVLGIAIRFILSVHY